MRILEGRLQQGRLRRIPRLDAGSNHKLSQPVADSRGINESRVSQIHKRVLKLMAARRRQGGFAWVRGRQQQA